MSKTDKDAPYHVRAFFDGEIVHNHTSGVCRVETFEQTANGARYHRHRYRDCPRFETHVVPCPGWKFGQNRYDAKVCFTASYVAEHKMSNENLRFTYGVSGMPAWRFRELNKDTVFTCGESHYRYTRNFDIACAVCDAIPTCYRYQNGPRGSYRSNSVPKWFVDHTWNNPERVRVRDELRELTKEFNANFGRYGARGGDADLEFENFQHRHRSRWYWD